MRCTTTKLLSKRDNGAVEFHGELRWDHVTWKPASSKEHLALAVELCARGVLRPANLHESPPPPDASGNNNNNSSNANMKGSPTRNRAVTPSPGLSCPEQTTIDGNSQHSQPQSPEGGVRPGGRISNFLNRRQAGRKGKAGEGVFNSTDTTEQTNLIVGTIFNKG